ncbi:MAG: hypothetical protein R3E01_15225 [Pirellulaceae bacterium]|nr:hypothetical protein [Planctomycetales bacterium]
MKINDFLAHHQIQRNPFAEEDAQTDPVFKEHCIDGAHHPTWDKIYGDPSEPSTSVVFGEKGAGKTAMRLQVARHLDGYNRTHSRSRVFVIHYDDFNPFLDQFRERLVRRKRRRADRVLHEFQLWDHIDAILSLGVTRLIDRILSSSATETPSDADRISPEQVAHLDRHQRRDLLLLAACYDHSQSAPIAQRWRSLAGRLKYRAWSTWLPTIVPLAMLLAVLMLTAYLGWRGQLNQEALDAAPWTARGLNAAWIVAALSTLPWLWRTFRCWRAAFSTVRRTRVIQRQMVPLTRLLTHFPASELVGQPLPNKDRTDDRYALLAKLQNVLAAFGYTGIVVLVDRIDEPHLVNGSPELMKALLWPMLDNKFLRQPGVGIKFMLPVELLQFIDREGRDFYQRARLDKQNLVPSLEWSGEALYDLANTRMSFCSVGNAKPKLRQLFEPTVSEQQLIDAFRRLRVPRHLFKFLYRTLVTHCNLHTDEKPVWQISPQTFESALAVYLKELDATNRVMAG